MTKSVFTWVLDGEAEFEGCEKGLDGASACFGAEQGQGGVASQLGVRVVEPGGGILFFAPDPGCECEDMAETCGGLAGLRAETLAGALPTGVRDEFGADLSGG